MKIDWQELSKTTGFKSFDDGLELRFESGRTQKVGVEDHGDAFLLISIVARPSDVSAVPDATLRAWVRNRTIPLVSFRVDQRGRMVGEVWVPKAGLNSSEWQFIVRHLAIESDRFEFQLTGMDQE